MNYKISYIILWGGICAGIVLAVISIAAVTRWLGWTGLVIMALSLIQAGIFYKCPHCNKPLPVRGKRVKRCPECREKL